MKLLKWWLEMRFRRKLSVSLIEQYLATLGSNHQQMNSSHSSEKEHVVRISCVQRKIRPVKKIQDYSDMLHGFITEAVENGSHLVVFPEYNFLDLMGMIPGFCWLNYYLTEVAKRKSDVVDKARLKNYTVVAQEHEMSGNVSPMLVFEALSGVLEPALDTIFSYFAKKYRIYIYSGSYVVKEQCSVLNMGSIYGPDGSKIGRQPKLHLVEMEAQMGMVRGTRLELYDLPIGRIVFPICMDATYFETFQIAKELGADMVVVPIANAEEYNLWKALKGIWPRVQESFIFGLKPSLNGWIAGMHYTGKAGIFGPIALTPEKDGILRLAAFHEGDEVVTADLDLSELRRCRKIAEYFGDSNPLFEQDYVKKTYHKEV